MKYTLVAAIHGLNIKCYTMSHEVPSLLQHPKVQIETKEDILFVKDQLEKTIKSTIELKKRQCGKDMKDSDLVFTKVQETMTRVMSPMI